jgi:predicted Ser/Thr protein kinase
MMAGAMLEYTDGSGTPQVFAPTGTQATVGRQAGSDLVIDWDGEVSRRHARLEQARGGWEVVDEGSSNGTFVNGEQVQGRRALNDGDSVRFGATTMTFRAPQPEPQAPPPAPAPQPAAPPAPPAAAPGDLSPGTTIADYEVEGAVRSGGVGMLYRARQRRLNRAVALKLVEPELARDPVIRERMRREARTVAALDHPNVVPLYEAGEENGRIYIVTRWVDGKELGALIRDEGAFDPGRAARLAGQIASALDVAHEKGLVHRDVKPSNVIVTDEDHVYLTDFGLAKRVGTASGLTGMNQMLGTLDYVAPEQIEGREPDARGDVYSLACVLFEMLTGEAPFAGQQGDMAKMWAHVNADPPPVRERRPDAPQPMEEVVRVGMAKAPDERPSAKAFRRGVLRAAGEPD